MINTRRQFGSDLIACALGAVGLAAVPAVVGKAAIADPRIGWENFEFFEKNDAEYVDRWGERSLATVMGCRAEFNGNKFGWTLVVDPDDLPLTDDLRCQFKAQLAAEADDTLAKVALRRIDPCGAPVRKE